MSELAIEEQALVNGWRRFSIRIDVKQVEDSGTKHALLEARRLLVERLREAKMVATSWETSADRTEPLRWGMRLMVTAKPDHGHGRHIL